MYNQKTKIRGWKKRVRHVEEWKKRAIERLDMEQFKERKREYAKLYIDPFYRLEKINPPMWYQRLIMKAMFEVYEAWERKLQTLNKEYYLKVWLFQPNFMNSQIVAATGEEIEYYENLFDKKDAKNSFESKEFPDFKWESAYDSIIYQQNEEELGFMTKEELEKIKNSAYKTANTPLENGELFECYFVEKGTIWIGNK